MPADSPAQVFARSMSAIGMTGRCPNWVALRADVDTYAPSITNEQLQAAYLATLNFDGPEWDFGDGPDDLDEVFMQEQANEPYHLRAGVDC